MSLRRNPLLSVFKHDGNTDIVLRIKDKTIDISVITTPLRRVRYHFDINNRLLELIIERRAVFMLNPRVPKPSAVMDRVYTIRKYKMKIEVPEDANPKFVILNPAPVSISKAYGASQTALYNNDDLIPGVKVCGLKWFVKNVH